jgi:glucosylceramidase
MKQFSIERDLGPNGLIPYIKRARRYGRFVLQAPMDYPPDWMLSDINGKQDVDAQYFPALARYYLWYLREYQRHGVFVDYISLFNEPGGYTKIPPEKIRDLLKGYVGPLFAQEHLKTRIQACEPVTRDSAYRQWTVILQDPAARKYVSAVAYHGYHFRDYDKIAALHEQHPDLPLWLTEIDHSYNTDTKLPAVLPRRDYEDGDFWGNQLFNDLETGTSAWIYWNMILDEKGGPWLVSPIHHDPEFNAQHPVVIVDRRNRTVFYTALYYYLTHFSRFVRPGAVRIGTSGSAEKVRCMAFRDNDGRNIVELLNSRQEDILVNVESHGSIAQIELPALSITTALWKQAAPPTRSQAFHTKSTHASGR